jgi:hypothetical protein
VTVTYTRGGSLDPGDLIWDVVGSHGTSYSQASDECPYPGVQPQLDLFTPVFSGQSATGYVCWTIAANDASSLELYFGAGTPASGTIWFAASD